MALFSGIVWFLYCVLVVFAARGGSGPKFVQEPSDIVVQKNRPASLHCVASGNPVPKITWWHNGGPIRFNSSDTRIRMLTNGTLHFSTIIHTKNNKPDEGYYQCVASSQVKNSILFVILSRNASLQVAGISSRISIQPSSLRVMAGDTARFHCQIRYSLPSPVVKWKFNDAFIQPSSRYTVLESLRVLQIRNVKAADGGSYSCRGQNPVNGKQHESSHSALSIISDLGFPKQPRITTKPVPTNATKGSLTVLECVVTGNPRPTVSWTKDGSSVVIAGHISIVGESNLQFSPVKVSDAGLYSCHATSKNNRVTAAAKLIVEYPPVIVEKPADLHARKDQNVEFKCVADGNPKPVIEWFHNAKRVKNGDYKIITNESLNVEEVWPPDDEGIYQCSAFNKLGSTQAAAQLFVYKQGEVIPTFPGSSPAVSTSPAAPVTVTTTQGWTPTAPQNVTAVALSNKVILVRWSPPIDQRGTIKHYGIFYIENIPGGDTSDIKITSGKSLNYKFTNLKPSTEYKFYVLAENEYGRGMVSDLAWAQTRDNSWAVPGPPRNFQAIAISDSSIRITWTVPATGSKTVARYVINYKAKQEMTEKETFTKKLTRQLHDLDADTKYRIIIYAENKHGLRSQPATVEAFTASGVPKDPPENFVLQADSSGTALIARWSPPTVVHGKVDNYVILFRKSGRNKNTTVLIPGDKSTFVIRGLEENTTYEAKIAARTETGQGPFTDTWVEAKTRPGKCRVDEEPGPPHKMQAIARGSVIHVLWQPPVDKADVCVLKYRLAWGPGAPGDVKKEVDNNTFQYIIGKTSEDKLRPNQQYVVKLTAWNKKGNGLDAQQDVNIANFGRPKEYLTKLELKALSPSVIKLTWVEPLVTSSKFTYHVTYILNQKTTYCGNTTNSEFNVTNLRAATYYIFNVRRNNDDYNASVDGWTLETKPGAPVDLNGNPSEVDPTQLDLQWQPPDRPNGKILMYEIRYSNNHNAKLKLWGKVGVNGSELMTTLTLTVGTKYFFKMRAKTRAGWGPYSEVYTITTPLVPAAQETTAVAFTASVPDTNVAKQTGGGFQDKTLWIVIAAVAGLTLVAIIIISVILCKKRSGDDLNPRKPPPKPTYKQAITANGSVKKKNKDEKPPDLWVNHSDNMEMKPLNPDPDVTNTPASVISIRNSDPDPIIEDARKFDPERSSFSAHNSDNEGDWPEKEPMLPQYPSGQRDFVEPGEITPSPPATPVKSYSPVTRPRTPENVYPMNQYPVTSTPRYDKSYPHSGSNPASDVPHNPAPRSYVYDADFFGLPNRGVPGYPMPQPTSGSPYRTLPSPAKPKPLVSPNDDIQIPPPTYSRQPRVPNGLSTLPPRYDDIMRRKQKSENDIAVADLEKEIAGLEGLMKDLNDITSSEPMV